MSTTTIAIILAILCAIYIFGSDETRRDMNENMGSSPLIVGCCVVILIGFIFGSIILAILL